MRSPGVLDPADDCRAVATSGLMALIGRSDGPPLYPAGLASGLGRLTAAVARWSAEVGTVVAVDSTELVTLRAGLVGLRRQGPTSANGTCRLLRGPDGWAAVNLPRDEDFAAVDAVTEGRRGADAWDSLQRSLDDRGVGGVVARARLLGIAAAPLRRSHAPNRLPWSARRCWPTAGPRALRELRIVDLSSMWAGPLAAALVARAGGRVVKVESTTRPDGARAVPAFFRALHAENQPVVTFDFASHEGRRRLRGLVEEADVVIESSRPRALEQLGCGPDDLEPRDGRVWVSITGYGRDAPGRDWVAFGDDAAVAGGLVAWEDEEHPVFCGDALADPVAGMVAAAAALEAIASGGGVVVDVSMQASAAVLAPPPHVPSKPAVWDDEGWHVVVDGVRVPVSGALSAAQPAP